MDVSIPEAIEKRVPTEGQVTFFKIVILDTYGSWLFERRYSQLRQLYETVKNCTSPAERQGLPKFPEKEGVLSLFFNSKSEPGDELIESRRSALEAYLKAIADREKLRSIPAIRNFLCPPDRHDLRGPGENEPIRPPNSFGQPPAASPAPKSSEPPLRASGGRVHSSFIVPPPNPHVLVPETVFLGGSPLYLVLLIDGMICDSSRVNDAKNAIDSFGNDDVARHQYVAENESHLRALAGALNQSLGTLKELIGAATSMRAYGGADLSPDVVSYFKFCTNVIESSLSWLGQNIEIPSQPAAISSEYPNPQPIPQQQQGEHEMFVPVDDGQRVPSPPSSADNYATGAPSSSDSAPQRPPAYNPAMLGGPPYSQEELPLAGAPGYDQPGPYNHGGGPAMVRPGLYQHPAPGFVPPPQASGPASDNSSEHDAIATVKGYEQEIEELVTGAIGATSDPSKALIDDRMMALRDRVLERKRQYQSSFAMESAIKRLDSVIEYIDKNRKMLKASKAGGNPTAELEELQPSIYELIGASTEVDADDLERAQEVYDQILKASKMLGKIRRHEARRLRGAASDDESAHVEQETQQLVSPLINQIEDLQENLSDLEHSFHQRFPDVKVGGVKGEAMRIQRQEIYDHARAQHQEIEDDLFGL